MACGLWLVERDNPLPRATSHKLQAIPQPCITGSQMYGASPKALQTMQHMTRAKKKANTIQELPGVARSVPRWCELGCRLSHDNTDNQTASVGQNNAFKAFISSNPWGLRAARLRLCFGNFFLLFLVCGCHWHFSGLCQHLLPNFLGELGLFAQQIGGLVLALTQPVLAI